MTREEAIEILNNVSFFAPSEINVDKAIDMAISALSIPIMEYPQVEGITPHLIDEPSDLISRADALREMAQAECGANYEHCCEEDCTCSYIQRILDIPSVSAERVGVWVRKEKEYNDCDGHRAYYWYECSECGARPPKDQWKNEWHSPYCPNCGARMEETT